MKLLSVETGTKLGLGLIFCKFGHPCLLLYLVPAFGFEWLFLCFTSLTEFGGSSYRLKFSKYPDTVPLKGKPYHCRIKKAFRSQTLTQKCETRCPPFRAVQTTGRPKSSFLYFISLYFSTTGLGKQIISTKVVSSNIIHAIF